MSDEELTFASAGVAGIHYAKCEACQVGACPGGWHTWASAEDRIFALKAGHPDPVDKVCGCDCRLRDPEPEPEIDFDELGTDQPCATCGETGACAWDSEGRPMIHATWMDDGEDE